MNKDDLENQELSEQTVSDERLVPVGEAIRYRKRAQSAESQMSELSEELNKANLTAQSLSKELENVRLENSLISKLINAGATDLEAAILLAKKRLDACESKDINVVIEQLINEKEHLFVPRQASVAALPSSGAKQRNENSRKSLEKIAQRASSSGSRVDVQEYMRARRQYI